MEGQKLNSSNLDDASYDDATRELTVKFRDGSVYKYKDVEPEHYAGLFEAESPGSYLHRHIKGECACERVE